MQSAAQRASSRSPRRSFASTSTVRKPPAGAAAVQQKKSTNDQGWAAWTPPREVFQLSPSTPYTNLKGQDQASGDFSQRPDEHKEKEKQNLISRSSVQARPFPHSLRNSGGRNVGNHDLLARGSGQQDRGDRLDRDEISWKGLRRKSPVAEAQKRQQKKQLHEYTRGDTSFRDEGQMRRLEAAKPGDFVGFQGLQKRKDRPFQEVDPPQRSQVQRLDEAVPSRAPPQEGSARPSSAITMASQVGRPFARHTGEWARYDTQAIQQTGKEDPVPGSSSTYRPMFNVQEDARNSRTVAEKSYNEWAEAVFDAPVASPARSEATTSTNTHSKSQTAPSSQTSNITIHYQDSRTPRTERESEIVAPSDRGRSTGPLTRHSSVNRRRERKSVDSSRYAEDPDIDEDDVSARRAARKLKMQKAKEREARNRPPTPIYLPEFISVSNLAKVLKVRVESFLRKTEQLGFEGLTNDHILDAETAGLIASEYNFEPVIESNEEKDLIAQPPVGDKSTLPTRPPVVTIMGHVDHGKTTLLDFLRKSSVAASEHGGITQHIGAFSVPMSGGRLVTFLDTPGHEAFLSMRQRGANVTDIVILVVAADDSVKPQTVEAIKHAQSANVPIIVAVNKVDKEDARPEQVKQDLARYGVEIEDFGGDTQVVCVSGKTGQGMAELEDAAVALADILDMRAATDGLAEGWILEATTKKAGRVATVLVRRGTLRPGDVIVAGTSWARVRSLRNEAGVMVDSAGPGTPVLIDGWRDQPAAGDEVLQSPANDEQKAKSVIAYRLEASQREQLAKDMTAVNESRRIEQEKREALEHAKALAIEATRTPGSTTDATDGATTQAAKSAAEQTASTDAVPTTNEVFFILKADVSGSVEAVASSVLALGSSEIRAHILRSGVGPITEFDVDHAAAASGHIINFNTAVDGAMARLAEEKNVRVLDQSIIYRLIDQVKGVLEEQLPETVTKRVVGEAEVAQVFDINVRGRVRVPVAGCRVRNGEIGKKGKVRVLRGGEVVFDGMLCFVFAAPLPLAQWRECFLMMNGVVLL